MHQPSWVFGLDFAWRLRWFSVTCARQVWVPVLACIVAGNCGRSRVSVGERLARGYCAACHAFPEPALLDKATWEAGVLPEMAPRLGVAATSLSAEMSRSPYMTVLTRAVSAGEWEEIVRYYLERSPDTLPDQFLPVEPRLDPGVLSAGPFVPRLRSSGIITLLKAEPEHGRIFVGEAGSNTLRIFDWNRRLLSSLSLGSPPTGLIVENGRLLVLESGILDPNDEPRGRLVRYELTGGGTPQMTAVLIDSLIRPVFVGQLKVQGDTQSAFVICEYGNNRGRLALYHHAGSHYERRVLDPNPGAIRVELRDITHDGYPDIVALLAQGDERIVLFANDGHWNFSTPPRVLARFPPVYGSMDFSLHDFNGDGNLDILYVNGDNFDYSRVLKPYHGIRILENDGKNAFVEHYFFPIHGAAQAVAADFDQDGDLDIVATSNFADAARHPERGIMFFENAGAYQFLPFAFTKSATGQWNVTAAVDLDRDGWLDVIVGAMDLKRVADLQQRYSAGTTDTGRVPILVLENRMRERSTGGRR